MGYCRNCGTELKGGEKECPACGIVQEKDALNGRKQKGYGEKADMAFDSEDIRENKAMAALAYLGALVAVPLFFAKDSRFARFHAGQGLALFLASVAYSVGLGALRTLLPVYSWGIYYLLQVLRMAGMGFGVLSVMGIVNVMNGEARELPVVGKWKLLKK